MLFGNRYQGKAADILDGPASLFALNVDGHWDTGMVVDAIPSLDMAKKFQLTLVRLIKCAVHSMLPVRRVNAGSWRCILHVRERYRWEAVDKRCEQTGGKGGQNMRVSHNEGGREKRHEVNLLTSTLIRCLTGPVLL